MKLKRIGEVGHNKSVGMVFGNDKTDYISVVCSQRPPRKAWEEYYNVPTVAEVKKTLQGVFTLNKQATPTKKEECSLQNKPSPEVENLKKTMDKISKKVAK